jgi:hypothetical protein
MATIRGLGLGGTSCAATCGHGATRPCSRTDRVFPPGVLRATDLVTCDIRGHHLQVGVPVEAGQDARASEGWDGANVVPVVLSVTRGADGSVLATCRRGRA